MLRAYIDDSGSHGGSSHLVLGMLIGDEEQWQYFDQRWRDLLLSPLQDEINKPALSKWHSVDCRHRKGEFVHYTDAEADRVQYLFRKCIFDSNLIGFAACIDKFAWNSVITGTIREGLGDCDQVVFAKCMQFAIDAASWIATEPRITVIVDKGWQFSELDWWENNYLNEDVGKSRIAGISTAAVVDCYGLQGADMMATEAYWFNKNWLKNRHRVGTSPHFVDFFTDTGMKGIVITENEIAELAKAHERDHRSL